MGRLVLRAGWDREHLAVVHINEVAGGPATGAHFLEFDSVHGRWPVAIEADQDAIAIEGTRIGWSAAATPGEVAWGDLGVDVVLECSGRFRSGETLAHYFDRGARKLVVAAPVNDGSALNVVIGVNDDRYDPAANDIVTAASCTTNCLAPCCVAPRLGRCPGSSAMRSARWSRPTT